MLSSESALKRLEHTLELACTKQIKAQYTANAFYNEGRSLAALLDEDIVRADAADAQEAKHTVQAHRT